MRHGRMIGMRYPGIAGTPEDEFPERSGQAVAEKVILAHTEQDCADCRKTIAGYQHHYECPVCKQWACSYPCLGRHYCPALDTPDGEPPF